MGLYMRCMSNEEEYGMQKVTEAFTLEEFVEGKSVLTRMLCESSLRAHVWI